MTHALTVTWSLASNKVGGHTPRERQTRFFERCRKWLRKRGVDWTVLWVEERNTDGKDVHLHALISLPNHVVYGKKRLPELFEEYLRSLLEGEPNVLDMKATHKHKHGPKGWLNYMLKAANEPKPDPEHGGKQLMRRAGTSRNLGRMARLRTGQ